MPHKAVPDRPVSGSPEGAAVNSQGRKPLEMIQFEMCLFCRSLRRAGRAVGPPCAAE
ncbi:hypothetical protein Sinac_4261 [Singulisphaera acidiphila DSM 18658]|uniref:Uncharacterized protein n=1 Tax=Singulisphaera acidiphila (strain ATCC BAA-1392 / DSM 18658 / VKM B-2454 / MOB10) TaxID=886293 RepID=L0DGS3_SINAD|nr:hypothetical protein Sinac_4261 [Singulisphaera acidiphila DSM 18658]